VKKPLVWKPGASIFIVNSMENLKRCSANSGSEASPEYQEAKCCSSKGWPATTREQIRTLGLKYFHPRICYLYFHFLILKQIHYSLVVYA